MGMARTVRTVLLMICDGLLLLPLACSLSASNEGSVPCIPYCLEVFFCTVRSQLLG